MCMTTFFNKFLKPKITVHIKKIIVAVGCMLFAVVFSACKETEQKSQSVVNKVEVRADFDSIQRGKLLFNEKCKFCHEAYSTAKIKGPGLKGILKNPRLPVSNKPATAENILKQLREPFKNMPSFAYLTEDELINIIAFLDTL